jgi:SnoaL-like domain
MTIQSEVDATTCRAIEHDCTRLVTAFAYLVDHRRYTELAALFVDDAHYERPGVVAKGQTELKAFFERRPTNVVTRHICTAPFFEAVGAQEAKSVTYLTIYMEEGRDDTVVETAGLAGIAEIHDTFRLTPAGWRIAQRVNRLVMQQKK